jgi:hypothetical protein
MRASTEKRLFAVIAAFLLFVAYLWMRDTVKVQGDVPRKDVRAAVAGLQEWSTPKLFRHIEVSRDHHGEDLLIARVQEPDHHWSITVFTNIAGEWRKCSWLLCAEDEASFKDFIQRYNR